MYKELQHVFSCKEKVEQGCPRYEVLREYLLNISFGKPNKKSEGSCKRCYGRGYIKNKVQGRSSKAEHYLATDACLSGVQLLHPFFLPALQRKKL